MATTIKLPESLTKDNNIEANAELLIREGMGVYVTLTRTDTGKQIELIEEGNGEPDAAGRIIAYARKNRRNYVVQRVTDALAGDWQRERLGLPVS